MKTALLILLISASSCAPGIQVKQGRAIKKAEKDKYTPTYWPLLIIVVASVLAVDHMDEN